MNSAKYNLPLAILMVFAIEPVVAQDLKADDFIFVPYSKPNPRNITGYYEVPEKFHRPANDGVELQLSRDENGRYNPQMVSVDAAKQMLAVGANGHFSPTKIIIGMPPYPELDEGLPAPTGAVSSATGSNGVVENPANQVGGVRGGLSESDTYIGLTQGQSFTMSNSNFVVIGNAMFPYSATEPYNVANNIQKPSGTNHQWLSMDFTTHGFNYTYTNGVQSGSSAGSHVGVILYRYRQIYAGTGLVGNVYPFVGIGAIMGDNSTSPTGVGCGSGKAITIAAGGLSPKSNAQTELFGRKLYQAAYDPYYLVTPTFSPNHDPYGPILASGAEIPASSNPASPGSDVYSPSCSQAGISDNVTYRMITHASDGGWASYYLYKQVNGAWVLLASPSSGASPGSTSRQIAPANYTTPQSTYQYGPFGATEYVFTSSPTSLYGTFNATMGGFAIAALGSATTWNINFANVQFGACLEGSTC